MKGNRTLVPSVEDWYTRRCTTTAYKKNLFDRFLMAIDFYVEYQYNTFIKLSYRLKLS